MIANYVDYYNSDRPRAGLRERPPRDGGESRPPMLPAVVSTAAKENGPGNAALPVHGAVPFLLHPIN